LFKVHGRNDEVHTSEGAAGRDRCTLERCSEEARRYKTRASEPVGVGDGGRIGKGACARARGNAPCNGNPGDGMTCSILSLHHHGSGRNSLFRHDLAVSGDQGETLGAKNSN
jgi:hypothetical protein